MTQWGSEKIHVINKQLASCIKNYHETKVFEHLFPAIYNKRAVCRHKWRLTYLSFSIMLLIIGFREGKIIYSLLSDYAFLVFLMVSLFWFLFLLHWCFVYCQRRSSILIPIFHDPALAFSSVDFESFQVLILSLQLISRELLPLFHFDICVLFSVISLLFPY